MQAPAQVRKRIVLVGGGHAHVTVLRAFGMRPEPGVALTLIAKELDAPYSGMLPGFVAGHYTLDECHIDLVRLAHFAHARLVHGEATGIDRVGRRVHLKGRPPLAYDLVSLDTGITPLLGDIAGADEHAISVKPVSTFAPRWQALEARALAPGGPRRIVVVGNGAAGFELVLAMRHRLLGEAARRGLDAEAFAFTLVGNGTLLATHAPRAQRLAADALARANVTLVSDDAALRIAADAVHLASGRELVADAVLVTTRAEPPRWFADLDLTRDARGFLAVRPTLQSIEDNDIFAAGDCAAVLEHPREKAGVFAVRQGPPLAENLRLRVRGLAAEPFVPQRRFLTLLSLGGKSAIACRGAFAAAGGWAWSWKDYIDRTFMDRFRRLPGMEAMSEAAGDDPMYCGGCAAKLGPFPLRNALDRLHEPAAPTAIRNLAPDDDAALVDLGGDKLRLETADFFRAIWPDPYVMGEIAAEHALSDIVAKGGSPDHALVVAQVQHAAPHLQEDDLYQLMCGARVAFDRHGIAVVGGHSAQGPELALGFFVSGTVERARVLRKTAVRAGDVLILTKPLGIGILFAAWMRRLARARDIRVALEGMRRSNAEAARIIAAFDAHAMTDVTGFGIAGHLAEMLRDGAFAARLDLASLPLYPGVAELARAGIGSSLLADNQALAADVAGDAMADAATRAVIFDPQTSGGLLAGIPAEKAADCLAALAAAGIDARHVGRIVARGAATGARVMLDGQIA